jgi:hypothetical protein
MLNYTESTHVSTNVPLAVLCTQSQERITEPLPEITKQQGREAGQAEAHQVLAQAKQHKGAPLTKPEMREAAYPLVMARLEEVETSDKPRAWYNGWCYGYMQALLDAERTAAPEPALSMADLQPEVLLVAGSVPIRHATWFVKTQALYNRVVAFYFEVIQAHSGILELSSKDALTALEKFTHATEQNPRPVMPLSAVAQDIPSMFRRAAIMAALGQAKSFYTHLAKWHKRKEQAQAKGKKFTIRSLWCSCCSLQCWARSRRIHARCIPGLLLNLPDARQRRPQCQYCRW